MRRAIVSDAIIPWGGALLAPLMLLLSLATPVTAAEGIDLGPLTLYPSIDIGADYDSNVLRRPMVVHDDIILTATPALKLWLPVGRFFIRGEGEYSINHYQEYDQQNNEQFRAGLATGLNLDLLDLTLGNTFTRSYLPSMADFEVAEYLDVNQFYAKLGLNLGRRIFVDFEYFNYDFAYRETEDLDREESTFSLGLQLALTQNIKILADIGYSDLAYNESAYEYDPNSPLWQDNEVLQYRGGIIWAFTARTTGDFRFGAATKTYDEDILPESTEWVAVGKLSTAFGIRTFLDLEVRRSLIESDYQLNPYYVQSKIELGFSRKLGRRLVLNAAILFQQDDYPAVTSENLPNEEEYRKVDAQIEKQNADDGIIIEDYTNDPNLSLPYQTAQRQDDYWGFKLGVDLNLIRWLGLSLGYEYVTRDSNLDRFDFTVNKVKLAGQVRF